MIKIGIMSGAAILPRVIAGIKESTYAKAQAIATRDIEKAKKLAQELDIPTYYGSYDELVN
ncbi:MAG: gfo/Idh/MocA family oxidoreductase, partial [Streptococcaceae bacterium]|nr:gfo/Idh/MocA family oxidoreductase [Streptococcaceae bacterium]